MDELKRVAAARVGRVPMEFRREISRKKDVNGSGRVGKRSHFSGSDFVLFGIHGFKSPFQKRERAGP
jgi:hypothetical protein